MFLLCYNELMSRKFTAKEDKECKKCGEEFTPKARNQQYCEDCHYTECAFCGKKIKLDSVGNKRPKKFCSKECYYSYRKENYNGENHPLWKGGKKKFTCKNCEEVFYDYPSRDREFCSKECASSYKWKGDKNPNWKGGLTNTKEKKREYQRKWWKNHPEKLRHKKRRRYARKKGADGDYTLKEWKELKEKFNHKCPKCGKEEPEIELTVDHIVPLSKGGNNDIDNIQPLCRKCNAQKCDDVKEFEPLN